jgi:hypothetical protein
MFSARRVFLLFLLLQKFLKFRQILPGTDVMITIFGDFPQFSAKKLAFFSETNVMVQILHYLALF